MSECLILPRKIVAKDGIELFEPATEDVAKFFGVYEVEDDGCLEYGADAPSRDAAEQLLGAL
jgi:hypothetical protein